jgi:hypothetical protein
MVGDRFIEAVNGKNHPLSKPKKKNLKHIKVMMLVAKDIEDKMLKGDLLTDAEIMAGIRRLGKDLEEGDRF